MFWLIPGCLWLVVDVGVFRNMKTKENTGNCSWRSPPKQLVVTWKDYTNATFTGDVFYIWHYPVVWWSHAKEIEVAALNFHKHTFRIGRYWRVDSTDTRWTGFWHGLTECQALIVCVYFPVWQYLGQVQHMEMKRLFITWNLPRKSTWTVRSGGINSTAYC